MLLDLCPGDFVRLRAKKCWLIGKGSVYEVLDLREFSCIDKLPLLICDYPVLGLMESRFEPLDTEEHDIRQCPTEWWGLR